MSEQDFDARGQAGADPSAGSTASTNETAPRIHELKCWPEFYTPLLSGLKTFELRKNDRGFQVGDVLWLREWDAGDPG